MVKTIGTIVLIVIMAVCFFNIIRFFLSTKKAFKKFDDLDTPVKKKLLQVEYFMILIRRFTNDELRTLSVLSDEELQSLNKFRGDVDLIADTAKQKIKDLESGITISACP